MRVLLVHNYYGSEAPSGENVAYLAERDLLRKNGHEVHEFTRHSDEIRRRGLAGMVRGGLACIWSRSSRARLRSLARSLDPDIIHFHNTFPLISPAAPAL